MSNEPTVIDMDNIDESEFTTKQQKEFADKKEKMIIKTIRPMIRELL